jgi:photosystem II stability/assembly factor-like uncharacterized protein
MKINILLLILLAGCLVVPIPSTVAESKDITWKLVSPWSHAGYKSVALHPKDPNIAYCSIDMLGLYKTTDGGRHWQPLGNDDGNPKGVMWRSSSKCILIDPQDPEIVYSGHRYRIYKSINGGKSWKYQEIKGKTVTDPMLLAFDPLNNNILYGSQGATGRGSHSWGSGIMLKTKDGGENWVTKEVFPDKAIAFSIVPDPTWAKNKKNECMRLYAATDKGFFISNNAGKSWYKSGQGLPDDYLRGCVMEIDSQTKSPILYVLSKKNGVYKSTDNGKRWIKKNKGLYSELGIEYNEIACGHKPGVIYVSLQNIGYWRQPGVPDSWKHTRLGILKTTDGGEHWAPSSKANKAIKWNWNSGYWVSPAMSLAVSPANPDIVYSMGETPAISQNGGKTWEAIGLSEKLDSKWKKVKGCGLTGGCISTVAVGADGKVHFGDADVGYWYSDDKGKTWCTGGPKSLEARGISFKTGAMDTASIVIDPDNPDFLYVCNGLAGGKISDPARNERGGSLRSEDGGESFIELTKQSGAPARKLSTIGLGPGIPRKRTILLASSDGKLYSSANSGKSFKLLKTTGLLKSSKFWVRQIIFDAEKKNRVLALVSPKKTLEPDINSAGVYESLDGGKTWNVLLPNVRGLELAVAAKDPKTIYLAAYPTSRHTTGGLYKSSNSGKNWRKILDLKYCTSVAINPDNPKIIYAGAYLSWWGLPKKKIGIYRSLDGGKTWQHQNSGFKAPNIMCIAVDPTDPRIIYAGTQGCGVWKGFDPVGEYNQKQ